jgi:hypothetical protein
LLAADDELAAVLATNEFVSERAGSEFDDWEFGVNVL